MIKILFLSANPTETTQLNLGIEVREIDNALRQADFRDQFVIEKHLAVRVMDLQSLLLRYKPDIVHFSGHGSKTSEIVVDDGYGHPQPITCEALSQLFSLLKENIRCVILNACYSYLQAKAIAQYIDCVIGMSAAIDDMAAIKFSASFYQALGYGKDIKTAFDLGCLQINLENLGEEDIPKLLTGEDVNPAESFFILGEGEARQPAPFAQSRDAYTNSIRSLLWETFENNSLFDTFCMENFYLQFFPGTPFAWKIELLIKHCQVNQMFNLLLLKIDQFNKNQYKQYVRVVHDPGNRYAFLWKKLTQSIRNNSFLKGQKRLEENSPNVKKASAELRIECPLSEFTPEVQAAAINAIAHAAGISPNKIKVLEIRQGSIILEIEIPSESLDKLISMYDADRHSLLRDLGISYVMETIQDPYNYENIKAMFIKGFTLEQIVDFCGKYNKDFLNQLPSLAYVEPIVEKLIEYARKEFQESNLLSLAHKYNPKAYSLYRPYYHIARKPFSQAKHRPNTKTITRKELFSAALRGMGIAMLGSFIFGLIDYSISQFNQSILTFYAIDMAFSLATFYLGDMVGRQVLKSTNFVSDARVARTAVISFILGYTVGYSIPFLLFDLNSYLDNKLYFVIALIFIIPLAIILYFLTIALDPLGWLIKVITLLIGSYSAYRRVKAYS